LKQRWMTSSKRLSSGKARGIETVVTRIEKMKTVVTRLKRKKLTL